MSLKFLKKSPLFWLYAGGAVLLVAAAFVWCFMVNKSPEKVFWSTIENGLTSHGVTVQSEQANASVSNKQTIRFSFGAENLSHSITTLSQPGTTVVNEMLGTTTVDYTRYLSIETDQKKANGSDIDFSKLIGVWAKGPTGSNQFFNQAVFGASLPVGGMGVPIGNLPPEARGKLIKQIRDDMVYQIDFAKVKKERSGGRLLYTYDATIEPSAYVSMMKSFSGSVGLHGLDQLDPENYRGQQPFKLKITVDARARQVIQITAEQNNSKQTYTGYGIPVQIDPPKNIISGAELQKRLQDLQ